MRFVEVKVTLRMEVPKGEHSFSSISLKRVLREGVMGLSKIAFFRTLLRIGILLTVRAFPIREKVGSDYERPAPHVFDPRSGTFFF